MTPVLAVREIEFSYGSTQVLFGVTFEVEAGECVALVGTNGAGKSTALRVAAGLERPSAGAVYFRGEDVTGRAAEDLAVRGLSLVQGGRAVFPDMSVAENLEIQALTIRRHRDWAQRQEHVLETFPALRSRWSQPAGRLSGGEQQQLGLAKALLLQPAVLCIDELSLGLAPVVIGTLLDVVRAVRDSGSAIVVVEQSLNVAAQVCERAVFLEKGAVRFQGRLRDLIERDDIARAVFFAQPVDGTRSNGHRARRR